MIIKVGGPDKDKLLNLLKENDILYKDITYRLFDELIGLEVTEMIDGDEEEIFFTLSEKELTEWQKITVIIEEVILIIFYRLSKKIFMSNIFNDKAEVVWEIQKELM